MSPQYNVDSLERTLLDSSEDSSELFELDSDTCSQTSQQPPTTVSCSAGSCCGSCDQPLQLHDSWLTAGDRSWHVGCLSCSVCGRQLQQRCFITRHGHLLCADDFNRLYNTCRRCGLQFGSPWEMAIAAPTRPPQRYHTHCFRCAVCQRPMLKDDLFAAVGDDVFCPTHAAGPSIDERSASTTTQLTVTRVRRRNARKHGLRVSGDVGCVGEMTDVRRKRHRIQFSMDQLNDLQTAFTSNPNPDSKSICDLATRLGLGKQHVQVWFQNRRAKERRSKADLESRAMDTCSL